MEIQRYARILNHRKMVVLLTAILTVAAVAFGSYRMTPIYSTSSLPLMPQVGPVSMIKWARFRLTKVQPVLPSHGCVDVQSSWLHQAVSAWCFRLWLAG